MLTLNRRHLLIGSSSIVAAPMAASLFGSLHVEASEENAPNVADQSPAMHEFLCDSAGNSVAHIIAGTATPSHFAEMASISRLAARHYRGQGADTAIRSLTLESLSPSDDRLIDLASSPILDDVASRIRKFSPGFTKEKLLAHPTIHGRKMTIAEARKTLLKNSLTNQLEQFADSTSLASKVTARRGVVIQAAFTEGGHYQEVLCWSCLSAQQKRKYCLAAAGGGFVALAIAAAVACTVGTAGFCSGAGIVWSAAAYAAAAAFAIALCQNIGTAFDEQPHSPKLYIS